MNFRRDEKLYQPYFNPKWNKCILYELADWFNGFAFKSSHFSEKGKPIIKIAELKNGITEQTKFTDQEFDKVILVKKGDLLFSWSGQPEKSIDVFWWKGPEGWLNQHIFKVIPKNCDKKFLYYLLKYLRPNFIDIARNKQTTGLGHVTKKDLQRIIVGLLLPEQKAIAHILSTLDDKIELNRRMNETLEEIAKAIFKSWFVDFDPVIDNALKAGNPIPDALAEKAARRRAILEKLEKEDPNLPKLPPEIARLFPDSFEDSPLGPIPKGWRVGKLGDLSEKPQYGYTASAKEEPVGPKFLRITDINKTPWIDWSTVPYCEISDEELEQYRLYPGDVLIARMADPGHGVLIEEKVEAVFASYLIRFRPKDLAYARYIQYWLQSDNYWELVTTRIVGTTRASLNAKVLSAFPILIPSKAVVLAFSKLVDALRNKVVGNIHESRTLATLRDTLLPKLISGQIRIKDAEKFVEEVL